MILGQLERGLHRGGAWVKCPRCGLILIATKGAVAAELLAGHIREAHG